MIDRNPKPDGWQRSGNKKSKLNYKSGVNPYKSHEIIEGMIQKAENAIENNQFKA